jgi:hypothetical protein
VLGELLDTSWSVNDRLRKYAEMMTSDTLDRDSIASVLAQLLTDSMFHAPDDTKFAVFHVAFAEAAAAAGTAEVAREDYERALAAVAKIIERNASRLLLPKLLRETTNLTPVESLARGPRQIAKRQVRDIRRSLESGGLWRELARTKK